MVDESEGYIVGALPPEVTEAVEQAGEWVGEKAGEAVGWATQEVEDVGHTIGDVGHTIGEGLGTAEKWIEEHSDDLLM